MKKSLQKSPIEKKTKTRTITSRVRGPIQLGDVTIIVENELQTEITLFEDLTEASKSLMSDNLRIIGEAMLDMRTTGRLNTTVEYEDEIPEETEKTPSFEEAVAKVKSKK